MCNRNYCPCSYRIDKRLFGDRESEFDDLDTTGKVLLFYEDCYKNITAKNDSIYSEKLNPIFLTFYDELEVQQDCSGLCTPPLFYFFKSNLSVPPKKTCKD